MSAEAPTAVSAGAPEDAHVGVDPAVTAAVAVETPRPAVEPGPTAGADQGPDAALPETPKQADPAAEFDRLDPQNEDLKLESGLTVEVRPLKTRGFFMMMRILTRGGGSVLSQLRISANADVDAFVAQLLMALVFAIPESIDETIDFVRYMVLPKDLVDNPAMKKAEAEALEARLRRELADPELDDVVTIVEAVLRREASDLKALGRRVQKMFKVFEKTGQASTTSETTQTAS